MKPVCLRADAAAMTLVEVLVVIALVVMLLMFAVPIYDRHPTRAPIARCSNNLREIGLGLTQFASDHYDRYPPHVSLTNGGSMEFVGRGSPAAHFVTLSNDIMFKWLICPTDKLKSAATTYTGFDDRNVSYFLSMDASPPTTQAHFIILAGDRHLEAAGQPVRPGLFALTTNVPVSWTRELHSDSARGPGGVTLFVDGHVQFLTRSSLGPVAQRQGLATNRLAVP